jgi:hypothetical protein
MLDKILIRNEEVERLVNNDDYSSAAKVFLSSQKTVWAKLADGYKSLESIKVKRFEFDGFTIKVQFNPGRIVSSSARVDQKSIKERKCFLCLENLPPEQRGILYKKNYLILVNPFPIFNEHFTLPSINHELQRIKGSFDSLLSFSKDLSKFYTVFYNGPKCGASAPDHLHFQSGEKYFMPMDREFEKIKNKYGENLFKNDRINISAIDDGLRRFISMESLHKESLIKYFNNFYDFLEKKFHSEDEPMMNILSFYEEKNGWRILIFNREKHRSSHYFEEGEKNILISAASVDMGGVLITPLEKDFDKISSENIKEIFKEIILNKEKFEIVKEGIRAIPGS